MTEFLKDCYFNGFCKGRKTFVPTLRYAQKKLCAMRHSAVSRLRAMRHSTELRLCAMRHSVDSWLPTMRHSAESIFVFWKKFYLRLRAMQLDVKFKSKIFLSTPRYAAQQGVDSALCHISGSRDSALCDIARSRDFPVCGIAQSKFNRISPRIRIETV
jgi:hypothetical protein